MTITKKTRFEIFKRDSFTCQYCGRSAPDVTLQVDHIEPKSKGGSDDIINLVTSCFDCNQGKKDRTLSDDTVIKKRKRQLDELQERREQLEMLSEWQRGLMELYNDTLQGVRELWMQLVPGYDLSDDGLTIVKKWLKRWDLMEIADAMRISTDQYLRYPPVTDGKPLAIPESVKKTFDYIPRIIANKQRVMDKPYLKELYYVRGILKHRISYVNDHKALALLEEAYESGITIGELTELVKCVRNWTIFQAQITALTAESGSEE